MSKTDEILALLAGGQGVLLMALWFTRHKENIQPSSAPVPTQVATVAAVMHDHKVMAAQLDAALRAQNSPEFLDPPVQPQQPQVSPRKHPEVIWR